MPLAPIGYYYYGCFHMDDETTYIELLDGDFSPRFIMMGALCPARFATYQCLPRLVDDAKGAIYTLIDYAISLDAGNTLHAGARLRRFFTPGITIENTIWAIRCQ